MKYYVYVSDTKVDMLFAQVPRSFVTKVAAELKVDLKIVSVSLKEQPSVENRYSRVKVVSEYLTSNFDVPVLGEGDTVVTPKSYFAGRMDMRWGIGQAGDGKRERVAYFTGRAPGCVVGLVGSPHHVHGQPPRRQVGLAMASFGKVNLMPAELSHLGSGEEGDLRPAPDRGAGSWLHGEMTSSASGEALRSVQMLQHQAGGTSQRFEFLAKTLAYDDGHDIYDPPFDKRLISVLGSPIYVAEDES